MEIDDVVNAIRTILIDTARRREVVTYDALLAALDDHDRANAQADLASVLRTVSVTEDEAGRGLLTSLVVRDDGLPGAGWFRLAADRGRNVGSDRAAFWRVEVERVYAAWTEEA